jgi:hypothetical protein
MSKELIEKYADLSERLDNLLVMKAELLDKAITPEVQKVLDDINAEFDPSITEVQKTLAEVKAQIEDAVLRYAKENPLAKDKSLKGTRYMAVYNKGRSGGWDTGKLEGYALVHPEIMQAKKPDGEPTVSFRQVK